MKISQVTEFLENAFVVLNEKYFDGELPSVVITIQSSPKTYGHYTKYDAWSNKQQGYREINISAETLDRPIEKVIATLIHEMVHHYCDLMGIKDCSRGNTYHNKRFKAECEQRGLIIDYSPKIGYSITSPAPDLIAFIADMGWEGADLARRGEDSQQGPGGPGGPQGPEGPKVKKKSSTRKYLCVGVSVKTSRVFSGRERYEIMQASLTESVRDLEVCYGTQFAEIKRSTTGRIMGRTNRGMPQQWHECPCVVQGK